MPAVPGCRTTFAKIRSIQAVDTKVHNAILQKMGMASHRFRPVYLLRFQSLARRITDEFTNAQHPLNMAGVSKCWQKSVIKLLPAAQLQSPML